MTKQRHVPKDELRRLVASRDRAGLLDLFRRYPISGGAPDSEPGPIYPEIPVDVEALSEETLDQLLGQIEDLVGRAGQGDPEVVGEPGQRQVKDIVAQTKAAVEGYERLRAERDKRDEASAQLEEELNELTKRVIGEPDPEADPEPEPEAEEEPEAEPLPEPVAASSKRNRALPARRREHEPTPAGPTITAAVPGPKGPAGTRFDGLYDIAEAMVMQKERLGYGKTGDKVPIATIHRPVAEEFTLRAGDHRAQLANQQKIDATIRKDKLGTLFAAGGICVMPTPRYDIETFGVTDEPVRDSVPSFNADRGGIAWYPPVAFSEVTSAIGVVTNAESIGGGSPALKTCQVISCPPTSSAVVDSRYQCVEIDNLEAKTFPERIASFLQNVQVARAQLAESDALAEIDAGTIAITVTGIMGALLDLIGVLTVQAVSIRSQFRLGANYPLRVILPFWIWDYLLQDVYRGGYDAERFAINRAAVTAMLRDIGINITETLDSQLIVQSGAGGTITWPTTVVIRMYPEGSYLHLDSGSLDIGLVRDSQLNQRNAYQMFAETWEKIAFVGLTGMSRKITITTKPTGLSGTGENTGATFGGTTY